MSVIFSAKAKIQLFDENAHQIHHFFERNMKKSGKSNAHFLYEKNYELLGVSLKWLKTTTDCTNKHRWYLNKIFVDEFSREADENAVWVPFFCPICFNVFKKDCIFAKTKQSI